MFITLEGGEGSGKSSLAASLKASLTNLGHDVVLTREPGGSEDAEKIRAILVSPRTTPISTRAEFMLFLAARALHVEQLIRPALAAGKIVICDRFDLSTIAYQCDAGKLQNRYSSKMLQAAMSLAQDGLVPDLTLLIDIDPAIGLKRSKARSSDATHFETLDLAFHKRVAKSLRRHALNRCRDGIIDGRLSIDQVHRQALSLIQSRFNPPSRTSTAPCPTHAFPSN